MLRNNNQNRIPHTIKMTVVFSFSLYGTNPKYTHGMIENAHILRDRFPAARVKIYITDDVPAPIRTQLATFPNVTLIPVKRYDKSGNMFDRFLTIDDDDCDIMFVRDADSRVHARDVACIEDFIASPIHMLHIIRDHYYHRLPIMGGMWGMRKPPMPLRPLIAEWRKNNQIEYMADQMFLATHIYPAFVHSAMIHDRFHWGETPDKHTPFRIPIEGKLFIGQVHDISESGKLTLVYDP